MRDTCVFELRGLLPGDTLTSALTVCRSEVFFFFQKQALRSSDLVKLCTKLQTRSKIYSKTT